MLVYSKLKFWIIFAPTYFNIKKRINFSVSVLQVNLMFLFWRCKQFRNSSMQCFKWKCKNASTMYILPMSDSNSERNFWSQLFTLYTHCFAEPCWWFSKILLRELLTLFGQELYEQHYEVVMDSQLEPTLCNVPFFFVTMTRYDFKIVSLNFNLSSAKVTLLIHSYCFTRNITLKYFEIVYTDNIKTLNLLLKPKVKTSYRSFTLKYTGTMTTSV